MKTRLQTLNYCMLIFILFILIQLVTTGTETWAKSSGDAIDQQSSKLLDKNYKIGAGDVLSLSVWKDSALSRQVVVLSDGTVSFPLIGQITAAGKSVSELEEEIRKKILRYLPNPVFDVSVMQPNSMIFYVIGNVKNPGRFFIQTDINVLQAIAMAGGLGDFADEDKIKIYREDNGQTTFFLFEYDEVINGNKMEQNIELQRGDVVVVP